MNTLYIISQVCTIIALTVSLTGKLMKNKKYILFFITVSSLFYVLSYVFLKSPLSAIINGVALVRGITFLYMDKKNINYIFYLIPIFVMLTSIAIAIGFLWSGYPDILIFIGFVITSFALAIKNTFLIRIGLILNSVMWAINNIVLGAYVNLASDILNIVILTVAIIIYNIILPRKQNKFAENSINEEKGGVEQIIEEGDTKLENVNYENMS